MLEECACAVCSLVCWYSCFPRRLSCASISLAYTIFPAYLAFLSKTKINEYFSFREIEADEISLRFRVFFRRNLSNEITRIKVIFQIVDGEIRSLRSISQVLCCCWMVCRHKERKTTQVKVKKRISVLSSWRLSRNSYAMLPTFLPSFDGHIERRLWYISDLKQTGYLTNCTQANLYGENYYLTSIHYNASERLSGFRLIFQTYTNNKQQRRSERERTKTERARESVNNKFIVNIVNSFIVVMDPARNISRRYFYLFIGHSQLNTKKCILFNNQGSCTADSLHSSVIHLHQQPWANSQCLLVRYLPSRQSRSLYFHYRFKDTNSPNSYAFAPTFIIFCGLKSLINFSEIFR